MPVFVLVLLDPAWLRHRRGRFRRGAVLPHAGEGGGFLLLHAARCAGAVLLRNRRRRRGDDHLWRLPQDATPTCRAPPPSSPWRIRPSRWSRRSSSSRWSSRSAASPMPASACCSSTCRSALRRCRSAMSIGGAFFLLALFAALASSISLMEVAVSWLDERTGVTRWGAALGVGFAVFVIGAGYVYSPRIHRLRRLRGVLAADAARRLPDRRSSPAGSSRRR